jgi:hypothetical protein
MAKTDWDINHIVLPDRISLAFHHETPFSTLDDIYVIRHGVVVISSSGLGGGLDG